MPVTAMRPAAPFVSALLFAFAGIALAQPQFPSPLDPARDPASLSTPAHTPLPEEYIWTAADVTALRADHNKFPWNRPELRIAPHLFRAKFRIAAVPREATLYVAGPRDAQIFLNGRELAHFSRNMDAPIGIQVFHVRVPAPALRIGDNTLAIEAVRGRGIVAADASVATEQLAYGEVLAVKLVPGKFGMQGQPLLISNSQWRSIALAGTSVQPPIGWSAPGFNDVSWPMAQSLGAIESNTDFFQWSADAGMYGWPGYLGISPHLRTIALTPVAVSHVYAGVGAFSNLPSLKSPDAAVPFTVSRSPQANTDAGSPSLLIDFGREITGRLYVESASAQDVTLSIAYGESELEALATGLTPSQQGGNYLGTNLLEVAANGVARGPKSGFRYVLVRFLRGGSTTAFKTIRAEGIYTPVEYRGSFESSDPLLNRIWETGAYTTHLCMQDGVWDAVKRDRGRWAGDLDIESRVIEEVFGNPSLTESTLRALVPAPGAHVNGIPNYSAAWITTLWGLYSRTGDREFVASQLDALPRILATIDASMDADGLFSNHKHQWLFIDWAPGLYGYTSDAVLGANLQFAAAYRDAAQLFRVLGDQSSADNYATRASKLESAIRNKYQLADGSFGPTWQINALADLTLDNSPGLNSKLWSQVLSRVKQDAPADQAISPFFNEYVLDAMARTGHDREALDWMRAYWGGMLAEGATSFWESYDLRWPKTNPHLSLQADGTSGFFVSLAHGWSSGPTAWLQENILGIHDARDGYRTVTIAPNLAGLDWARGAVPTPRGVIAVSIDKASGVTLDLPQGIETAMVLLPYDPAARALQMDGRAMPRQNSSNEYAVELHGAGHHTFIYR
jgi:alpha-L-rhamnosidase